jgi:hypothetical protein
MWDNEIEVPRLSMTIGEIVSIMRFVLNEKELEEIAEDLLGFKRYEDDEWSYWREDF